MNNNLISVIIPVYNVKDYLNDCLESIINQSYKELEIIIIDDGSNDGSELICDTYKEKDSRIRVYHIENSGVSNARNIGLDVASGSYVTFVDSDDLIDERAIEILVNYIDKYNSDCVICGCNVFEYTKLIDKNRVFLSYKELVYRQEKILDALFYMEHPFKGIELTSVWGKLYKMEHIKNIRFDKRMTIGEDFLFNYYALNTVNNAVIIEAPLYNYRFRPSSAMNSLFDYSKIINIRVLLDCYKKIKEDSIKIGFISRTVNIAIVIYNMISDDRIYPNESEELKNFIRCNRLKLLLHTKTRIKLKCALVVSFFGFNVMRTISHCFYK